jgi:Zinc-binding dehydrogenase
MFVSRFVKQLRVPSVPLPSKKNVMAILRELLEAGKITPIIDSTYPLSETREALRHMIEDELQGKVVIIAPADQPEHEPDHHFAFWHLGFDKTLPSAPIREADKGVPPSQLCPRRMQRSLRCVHFSSMNECAWNPLGVERRGFTFDLSTSPLVVSFGADSAPSFVP